MMSLAVLFTAQCVSAMTLLSNTTVGVGSTVAVNGKQAFVAGGDAGGTLHFVDATDPTAPALGASVAICGSVVKGVAGLAALDNTTNTDVFVICPTGLNLYTFSQASLTKVTTFHSLMSFSLSVVNANKILATTTAGADLLSLKGGKITKLGHLPGVQGGSSATLSGDGTMAFTSGEKELSVFNVTDPVTPVALSTVAITQLYDGNAIASYGTDHVLVGGAGLCLGIVDIRDPKNPVLKATIPGNNGLSIEVHGTNAYVACTGDGSKLFKVDLSNPDGAVKIAATQDMPFIIEGVAVSDDGVFVTSGSSLTVFAL